MSVRYLEHERIVYRVKLTTGDRSVDLGIAWTGPSWPEPRNVFGSPIGFGQPTLKGPGVIKTGSQGSAVFSADTCLRGAIERQGAGLELPANSSSTFVLPAYLTAPPWPDTSYITRFNITVSGRGAKTIHLRAPRLRIRGERGVHIRMHFADQARRETHNIAVGDAITIVGGTTPPVVDQRLGFQTLGPSGMRVLGSATTDGNGRFQLAPVRFDRRGIYLIYARYRNPAPGLLADSNCDLAVSVGP